jgi:hypothetical protein
MLSNVNMIDPLVGLQKQCIEAMQQQGAQCKANKHSSEDVEDCGFHDVASSIAGRSQIKPSGP